MFFLLAGAFAFMAEKSIFLEGFEWSQNVEVNFSYGIQRKLNPQGDKCQTL